MLAYLRNDAGCKLYSQCRASSAGGDRETCSESW